MTPATKPAIVVKVSKGSLVRDFDRGFRTVVCGRSDEFETVNYSMAAAGDVVSAIVYIGGHRTQVDLAGQNSAGNSWRVK